MEVIRWQLDLLDLVSQGGDPSSVPKRRQNSYTTWEAGRNSSLLTSKPPLFVKMIQNDSTCRTLVSKRASTDVIEPKRVLVWPCMTYMHVCLILDWLCMGRHVLIHLKVFLKTTLHTLPNWEVEKGQDEHGLQTSVCWSESSCKLSIMSAHLVILSSKSDQHFFPSTGAKIMKLWQRFRSVLRCVKTVFWCVEGFCLSRFRFSKGESIGQAVDRLVHGRLGVLARGILLTGESEEADTAPTVWVTLSRKNIEVLRSGHPDDEIKTLQHHQCHGECDNAEEVSWQPKHKRAEGEHREY